MIKILDIEKAILMLILFSIAILGYEVQFMSYVLSAIVVGYFMLKGELQLSRYGVLIPLILLLILGTRIGAGFRLVDIVRDYIYFSSPILSFLLGVILYKRISLQKLMILFVAFGTIYSLYYLLQSTLQFGSIFISDTYDTRYSIGTGTPLPMMALFFTIFFYKDINTVFRNHYLLLGIILFNAIVMYYFASRVYYFSFLIFILLYLFYAFVAKYKKIGLILFSGVFVILLLLIYQMINGEGFVAEKMRNSLDEMFIQEFDGYDSVINNWRAYELFEAFNTMMEGSALHKIIGFGFGKLVHLEMELLLPGIELDYIPILHNGFAYVMVKTGAVGIFIYVLFAINLLLKSSKRIHISPENKTAFILLLATIIAVYFTTLVVNGFFSGESFFMLLFIGYLYEFLFNNTESDENKHNNSNVQCGIEIKQVP